MREPILYILLCLGLVGAGCASSGDSRNNRPVNERMYTSAFPSTDVSKQLAHINEGVYRYTVSANYKTYFYEDTLLNADSLQPADITALATRSRGNQQSKAGTAIALYTNKNNSVLLSAAHVTAYPDTVISYRRGPNLPPRTYVAAVSIKQWQRNLLKVGEVIQAVEPIAKNMRDDIALLAAAHPNDPLPITPIHIPWGNARDLMPGSFIYVMGYPLSRSIITRGIVSSVNYDNRGSFLSDALFNRGISGGLVIASRNSYKNFEWVGMAVSASALEQQFLVPDPAKESRYYDFQPYTDTALVSRERIIKYGITQVVPIEQILTFMLQNEDKLRARNFTIITNE